MKIKLLERSETGLNEDGFWQRYQFIDKNEKVVFDGYKLFDESYDDFFECEIISLINSHIAIMGGIENFPKLNQLNDYLVEIITECHQSENEMWFVEWDDENLTHVNLNEVVDDIEKWKLNDVVQVEGFDDGQGDSAIEVYGGVSELINWVEDIDETFKNNTTLHIEYNDGSNPFVMFSDIKTVKSEVEFQLKNNLDHIKRLVIDLHE